MIIYPSIELRDGKCVSLRRGSLDDCHYYDIEPLDAAKRIVASGAEWLHLVDIDGILQGGRHNADTILEIVKEAGVPCQVGGGIRTMASAAWWLEHGLQRVVLGTAAIKDRTFVREACSHWPDRIVVSVDAVGGHVAIEGWRETTTYTALDVAKDFEKSGAAAIIFTDIDMSNEHADASFAETTRLAGELDIPVISSGCVRTLDDVSTLKHLYNINGAVIGRAFFERKVRVSEAVAVAKQKTEVAEFI